MAGQTQTHMTQKRYQYIGPKGIKWTQWFRIPDDAPQPKWQLKGKLLNEYRTV